MVGEDMRLYPYGLKLNPYPSSPTTHIAIVKFLAERLTKMQEGHKYLHFDLFAKVNGSNPRTKFQIDYNDSGCGLGKNPSCISH